MRKVCRTEMLRSAEVVAAVCLPIKPKALSSIPKRGSGLAGGPAERV